jgi:hypothetical protein
MSDHYGSQQRPDFTAPGESSQRPSGPVPLSPTQTSAPQTFAPQTSAPHTYSPQDPPHAWSPQVSASPALPVQRPALITLSVVLVVTGSLLWMTALGFAWVTAYVARDGFSYTGVEGSLYHMLSRFHLRMLQGGLAIVFFGFPTAAVVLAFFLLMRRIWPRIALSVLGGAAIVVPGLLLRDSLAWVVPWAAYIAFSCLILWAPSVSRWCESDPQPGRMAR